ncbi:MAG: MmgE/PrpD family protein 4 [Rhizobiales bacterium 65-9]|nr:MAG: MmgE/PrpD family protein 4 [Rhizobiales bacterium 65-9]
MLNGYGIGLSCYDTPYVFVARRAVLALEGEQSSGASLFAHGAKVPISGAAMCNAALFHGRGQEDTCGAAHLGAILIPLLSALAESRRLPMERFIPALVAGYETGGLLEQEYAPQTTPKGLRSSPIYGALAAAAAASRMMGLSGAVTAAAIANAASFAGGVLQSFADGTDEWRYQVGVAARHGLLAAELAAAGSVSAPHAIEGPSGFVKAFAGQDCDVARLAARLGREWSIHRVTFKPYPVCAFNQTPVTAALELRSKLRGETPRRVRVRMNPYETGYAGMDSKGPFHTISGTLMSIPFCIALTLLRGEPTMAAMTTYDDCELGGLIDCIDLIPDESVARLCCIIDADLDDGRTESITMNMTTKDFNFDRRTVSNMVRRIGQEQNVSMAAFDAIEIFANDLPNADIKSVVKAFSLCPKHENS